MVGLTPDKTNERLGEAERNRREYLEAQRIAGEMQKAQQRTSPTATSRRQGPISTR